MAFLEIKQELVHLGGLAFELGFNLNELVGELLVLEFLCVELSQ